MMKLLYFTAIFAASAFAISCGGNSAANGNGNSSTATATAIGNAADANASSAAAQSIEVKPNSPSDTVRAFYDRLRTGKIRDAMFLTNLRPAIEGLTDSEMQDLQVDFDQVAKSVPGEFAISGETISNNSAVVTAKLPDNKNGAVDFQQLKLKKDGDFWILQLVDETAAANIKKAGKNYFFDLRVATREKEAEAAFDKIIDAQSVFAMRNEAKYGTMSDLIKAEILSSDFGGTDLNGYKFEITPAPDQRSYIAAAAPVLYGKTGKKSYVVSVSPKGIEMLKSADLKGEMPKKY